MSLAYRWPCSWTTILRFGTEYQKNKYLPGVARGEIDIALGYTEPGAGSDIASVQLRAVESDDVYILNGQKVSILKHIIQNITGF